MGIMASVSIGTLLPLFLFIVKSYDAISLSGLFQEDCGDHIIPTPNQTNHSSDGHDESSLMTCDTAKHLECVHFKCECLRDYVHDGNCGCRWGLVGYGAKCIRHTQNSHMKCDYKKNLTCDSIIHRCLCTMNHIRRDDACIPGTGAYQDDCDEPEDHEFVLKILNSTRRRVRRENSEKGRPGQPFSFENLMARNVSRHTSSYNQSKYWKEFRFNTTRRPKPKPSSGPQLPHVETRNREDVVEESVSTTVKCDPSRYSIERGGHGRNQTSQENNGLFLAEFGKTKKGCDPELNLQCLHGKCRCANEGAFKMFQVVKSNNGKRPGCKRREFYSCIKNEDCANGHCVAFKTTHETQKFCYPEGKHGYPDGKLSSASTFQHLKVSFLLIPQMLAIYTN